MMLVSQGAGPVRLAASAGATRPPKVGPHCATIPPLGPRLRRPHKGPPKEPPNELPPNGRAGQEPLVAQRPDRGGGRGGGTRGSSGSFRPPCCNPRRAYRRRRQGRGPGAEGRHAKRQVKRQARRHWARVKSTRCSEGTARELPTPTPTPAPAAPAAAAAKAALEAAARRSPGQRPLGGDGGGGGAVGASGGPLRSLLLRLGRAERPTRGGHPGSHPGLRIEVGVDKYTPPLGEGKSFRELSSSSLDLIFGSGFGWMVLPACCTCRFAFSRVYQCACPPNMHPPTQKV